MEKLNVDIKWHQEQLKRYEAAFDKVKHNQQMEQEKIQKMEGHLKSKMEYTNYDIEQLRKQHLESREQRKELEDYG